MSDQADEIKVDEMGGTDSTHEGDEKCLQKFVSVTGREYLGDSGTGEMILL
jgi:hypothetical protein